MDAGVGTNPDYEQDEEEEGMEDAGVGTDTQQQEEENDGSEQRGYAKRPPAETVKELDARTVAEIKHVFSLFE